MASDEWRVVRKASSNVSGYVLAGGASRRFGRDKALVEMAGMTMLNRMIALLSAVTNRVRIVSASEKRPGFGMEVVPDQWPGEGPLGGIITALEDGAKLAPQPEWSLIVSCDMPFLTREWLTFLCERAATSQAKAVLPNSAHGAEPLCACYHTTAAGPLREIFESGVRKITEALKQVTVEKLDEADWKRFDSSGRLFWNMNTEADYREARRILEAELS